MSIQIGGPGGGDIQKWDGTAVPTPDTAGYPKVTIKAGTGTGEVALSSGQVTVGTNNDKTGYTASTVSDKTGYSLTAGSYSVRASSTQHVTASLSTGTSTSTTATISSVTTTRAVLEYGGNNANGATAGSEMDASHVLTNATTITFNRVVGTNVGGGLYASGVLELDRKSVV